jgi:hypothetical protein
MSDELVMDGTFGTFSPEFKKQQQERVNEYLRQQMLEGYKFSTDIQKDKQKTLQNHQLGVEVSTVVDKLAKTILN